ncbi:MAG: carbohydrate-binding domain-containing protein [Breznakia sp.]
MYKHIPKSLFLFALLAASACSTSSDTKKTSNAEDWQVEKANIILKDNATSIDGEGAKVENNIITITKGGVYNLSGSLNNGQIMVNAADNNVQLILNGVTITNKTTAAIHVVQAKNTYINVKKGSENYLNSSFEDTNAEVNATVFASDDLFIDGSGTLSVSSSNLDAIAGKDDVNIQDCKLIIKAGDDGIRGKDSLTIKNAILEITSNSDALKATNDTDNKKGYIDIKNSALTLTSKSTSSAKGMQAFTSITIDGGTFIINSVDDAIHAQNVTINDGNFTIVSQDDGIHADNLLNINDGNITIKKSYEGLEASEVNINGGTHTIYASDDGINAAGGSDSDNTQAMDDFSKRSGTLTIRGGVSAIYASGDGLDANGDIVMEGGEVYINGPENGGNGSLDYDGNFTMSAGTLLAAGASDMPMAIGTSSTQNSILVFLNTQEQAHTKFSIYDNSNTEIITYSPTTAYSAIVFSSASLKLNETYTIKTANQSIEMTLTSTFTQNQSSMNGFGNAQEPMR